MPYIKGVTHHAIDAEVRLRLRLRIRARVKVSGAIDGLTMALTPLGLG